MSEAGGTGGEIQDRALEAFRRLLALAPKGEQARVDAIVALSQRTVFVPTWPAGEGFRTLVNSAGLAALPVFADMTGLTDAARRFGWLKPDGTVPYREVGAREAFTHAIAHNVPYVVVDIHAQHALELERHEVEPLLAQKGRFDSGPFAGTGRLSSTLMKAVRATPVPPVPSKDPITAQMKVPADLGRPLTPMPFKTEPSTGRVGTRTSGSQVGPLPAGPGAVTPHPNIPISPLREVPPDTFLDALADIMRGFPEVEWACLFILNNDDSPSLALGLRLDQGFRTRQDEITALLEARAVANREPIRVVLLDDPAWSRVARNEALMFYPWRR